jgi:hypothetical protein
MTPLQADREAMTVAAGALQHGPLLKLATADNDERLAVDLIGDIRWRSHIHDRLDARVRQA